MQFRMTTSPHQQSGATVHAVMLQVVAALIPGIAVYAYFFGWGILVNASLGVAVALAAEAGVVALRGRNPVSAISDGSAVVTALLLALALPPFTPWWATLLGVAFAIVIAKHLYGGLGYNVFNPAMAGYAMLLISFPREMTQWPSLANLEGAGIGLLATVSFVFTGAFPGELTLDAVTGATPLDHVKTELESGRTLQEIYQHPVFGVAGGAGWETINIAFLLGGLYLMARRVIGWQIPVGLLGGLAGMALIFWTWDPATYATPMFHLMSGAAILGAFFIATDPVSASTTPRGRLIFGFGIGALTYFIRTFGGYPDAIAFAVLLMNMAAPTIDYYTKPRTYGHASGNR